jgi:hypothetical protein
VLGASGRPRTTSRNSTASCGGWTGPYSGICGSGRGRSIRRAAGESRTARRRKSPSSYCAGDRGGRRRTGPQLRASLALSAAPRRRAAVLCRPAAPARPVSAAGRAAAAPVCAAAARRGAVPVHRRGRRTPVTRRGDSSLWRPSSPGPRVRAGLAGRRDRHCACGVAAEHRRPARRRCGAAGAAQRPLAGAGAVRRDRPAPSPPGTLQSLAVCGHAICSNRQPGNCRAAGAARPAAECRADQQGRRRDQGPPHCTRGSRRPGRLYERYSSQQAGTARRQSARGTDEGTWFTPRANRPPLR